MTQTNFATIQAAARAAVDEFDPDDIDPDDIDQLAADGAWEWADLYGPAGARVYIEEFTAYAIEALGL